jgi:hypothetical protein
MANIRPIKAGRDHDYILMELGKTLASAIEKEAGGPEKRKHAEIFDSAMRHLPATISALSSAGFGLGKNEEKIIRGLRRRKIRTTTWRCLGAAARQLDLSRPQLLRALLRLEFSLGRTIDASELK